MTLPYPTIRTPRLLLRQLRDTDFEALAAMNADTRVMEYFPACLSRSESDAVAERLNNHYREHGYGFWVVEAPGITEFAGMAGLLAPRFEAHFTPCVEIGWRFAYDSWGHGWATESALAVLDFAFTRVGLAEIVSLTVPANERSIRVMERIGMTSNPAEDFDYPDIPEGHHLRRHVLYRLSRDDWAQSS